MTSIEHAVPRLAVALGIGLLIGIERERSKAEREIAGVRTFMLTSLTGAMAHALGGELALVALACVVGLLAALGYRSTSQRDPGLTTEVALLTTFLLGAWSMIDPAVAAGLGVVVAIVLAARPRLHRWVRDVLTNQEVHDGLVLAAAALVILPLAPDRAVDPWGIVFPRKLWALAVMVMAANALGYIAIRTLGARIGLPVAGLFSGFVSSSATIAAMGTRSKQQPVLRNGAVAGAALSSVATIVQLAFVLAVIDPATLQRLTLPLVAAGAAAVAYGGLFTLRSARAELGSETPAGRPFDPRTAIAFTAIVSAALLVSAFLTHRFGDAGLMAAAIAAGLADAHAAAASAASLAARGVVDLDVAARGVLAGFTANTATKCVVAITMGDRIYALEVIPGLLLMLLLAWGAALTL